MKDLIKYSKEQQLEIPAHRIKIFNLNVLVLENLRFYEKFIVLALKGGVKADKTSFDQNLIDILSQAFNIKRVFVELFIDCFNELGYIKYDLNKHTYYLSDKFEIIYNEDDKSIIMAKTKEKKIEISNLYAVPLCETILASESFDEKILSLINVNKFSEAYTLNDVENFVLNNREILKDKIRKTLLDNNYSYKSLEHEIDFFEDNFKIRFNVLVHYEFKDNNSIMNDFSINPQITKLLNKDKIKLLVEQQYKNDIDLPRFIKQREYFNNYSKDVDTIENKLIEEANLQKDISLEKEKITLLEKNLKELQKELKKIEKSKNTEKESIMADLTQKINELQKENLKLKEINESTTNKVIALKKENTSLMNNLESNDKANEKGANPTVINVKNQYNEKSLLSTEIKKFATAIDECLSLSNCLSYDLLFLNLKDVRSIALQTFKLIFDVLTGTKEEKLVSYISGDKFKMLEFERKYKISASILDNMDSFRRLANACGHFGENNELTETNREIQEEFKSLSKEQQQNILLSFLYFLSKLDLTQTQKNKIEALLRNSI